MKFGQVENPEEVDFTIPPDHPDTKRVLAKSKATNLDVYVGCSKWNSKYLKGFYPEGIKDELAYYGSQFNCVELNATFYKRYWEPTYKAWRVAVPDGFKFSPKFNQGVTHYSRLKDIDSRIEEFAENVAHLGDKLGPLLLQMHNNFPPKNFDRVAAFVELWKYDLPVAIEFRQTEWYNNPDVTSRLYDLLERNRITNVLVDTAGRRDLMHMRLTTGSAFVRWVGANHPSDYDRLDAWVNRIALWKKSGLRELYFFVHQNIEKESPLLSAYFIEKLNKKIGTKISIPKTLNSKPEKIRRSAAR
ncbi:MAG: DUF72 domain-containing protein [Acidobacteria bacterium]|nr:DUF72 domain-containing protein [Acidobacteriota bacterium]